jgi:hypothetical protein
MEPDWSEMAVDDEPAPRRRRRPSRPARRGDKKSLEHDPARQVLEEALARVVARLTSTDEAQRHAAVVHIQRCCPAAAQSLLIGGLVQALAARRQAVRHQAHASLVQFGQQSLPALQVALLGHSDALRAAVVKVLTDLLSALSAGARDTLLHEVVIAEALSSSRPSHPDVVNLLVALRATRRALSCPQQGPPEERPSQDRQGCAQCSPIR